MTMQCNADTIFSDEYVMPLKDTELQEISQSFSRNGGISELRATDSFNDLERLDLGSEQSMTAEHARRRDPVSVITTVHHT